MRTLARNLRPFYILPYKGEEILKDRDGNSTGEKAIIYDKPIKAYGNISTATGSIGFEVFGRSEDYDRLIVCDDPNLPITETSVLFIDAPVSYKNSVPQYNYVVRRIARSLNSITVAVRKTKNAES